VVAAKPAVAAKPGSPKAAPATAPRASPKKQATPAAATTTATTGAELDAVLTRLLPLEAQYVRDALEDWLEDNADVSACVCCATLPSLVDKEMVAVSRLRASSHASLDAMWPPTALHLQEARVFIHC
jgi:hypothetical protein